MADHDHPPSDSPEWDRPDYCPFCGERLPDGGPGFVEHVRAAGNASCLERWEAWRENVADDIGGEWSG